MGIVASMRVGEEVWQAAAVAGWRSTTVPLAYGTGPLAYGTGPLPFGTGPLPYSTGLLARDAGI